MTLSSVSKTTSNQIEALVQEKKGTMSDVALVMILSLLLENLEHHMGVKGHQDANKASEALDDLAPKIKFKDGKMILISHEKGKEIESEILKTDSGFQVRSHITGKTAEGQKIDITVIQNWDFEGKRPGYSYQGAHYTQYVEGSIGKNSFAGQVAHEDVYWLSDESGKPIASSEIINKMGYGMNRFDSIPGFSELHLNKLLPIAAPKDPSELTHVDSKHIAKFLTKSLVKYADKEIESHAKKEVKDPLARLLLELLLEAKVQKDSKKWEKEFEKEFDPKRV